MFPDLSKDGKAFKLWSNRANEIQKRLQGTYFHVSDLLEQLAPQQDKEQGKDIADYLIKQDWRLFRKHDIKEDLQPEPEPVETLTCEKSEKSEALKKTFISQPDPLNKAELIQPDSKTQELPKKGTDKKENTFPHDIITKYKKTLKPEMVEFLNGDFLNSDINLINLIDDDLIKVLNQF